MRRLYSYFRSSASWRVRIALALKGLDYDFTSVHLRRGGGEQFDPEFLKRNPQGLIPVLEDDGLALNQSLAILEYLDDVYPDPALVRGDPAQKARIRSVALTIACEIHPLNNLRVLQYLGRELGAEEAARDTWYAHWVTLGFDAIEPVISSGPGFCFGDAPTLADVCLVPQVYNAARFKVALDPYPRIRAVNDHALAHPAFADTAPDGQPDVE